MIRLYSWIVLCLQAVILPTYIFLLGVVEKTQNLPPHELKIPHNQFYLDTFSINLARLGGISIGIAIATIILALVMYREVRNGTWSEKFVILGTALVPIAIGFLARNQM